MDIKTPLWLEHCTPEGEAERRKGETVADNSKMGLEDEGGNFMHDSFWNSFVTLLSALSLGHFKFC